MPTKANDHGRKKGTVILLDPVVTPLRKAARLALPPYLTKIKTCLCLNWL